MGKIQGMRNCARPAAAFAVIAKEMEDLAAWSAGAGKDTTRMVRRWK